MRPNVSVSNADGSTPLNLGVTIGVYSRAYLALQPLWSTFPNSGYDIVVVTVAVRLQLVLGRFRNAKSAGRHSLLAYVT